MVNVKKNQNQNRYTIRFQEQFKYKGSTIQCKWYATIRTKML